MLIGRWRIYYNTVRPHSSLGYRPPAPEAILIDQLTMSYTAIGSLNEAPNLRPVLS